MDDDPRLGQSLGRFRLDARLGEGGMGVVYAATDETLQRRVALKVLPAETSEDPERRARLQREARAAAQLTHPNIATIYDVGEADGLVFVAMELVEGRSLRAHVADGQLTVPRAIAIAISIAEALARAHEKNIVHRDLKPDNVMIADDGAVKVLDFGLAKFVQRESEESEASEAEEMEQPTATAVTEVGRILGTPGYMSPEQAAGKGVDHRTDLFALGVMVFEMLSGERPFRGDSVLEAIVATTRDDPGPPSKKNAEVPPELDAIVARCLAKDAADRWPSARALSDALREIQTESADIRSLDAAVTGVSAASPPTGLRAAVGVLVGVVLIGGAIFFWRTRAVTTGTQPSSSAISAAASSAAPTATTLSDLPPPKSSHPAAVTAYAAGMQQLRDGSWGAARREFERAHEIDPEMPAVHLRLAIEGAFNNDPLLARSHFSKAHSMRARLTARDRALLEAIEPVAQRLRTDPAEAAARLKKMSERFPGDTEPYVLRGWLIPGDPEEGLRLADRATLLDPKYADGWQLRGQSLTTLARLDEAIAAYEQCAGLSTASTDCASWLARVHDHRGNCVEMEKVSRQMIDRGLPYYSVLAMALHALGRPEAVIAHTIGQIPDKPRGFARTKRGSELSLAVLRGDFVSARAIADRWSPNEAEKLELPIVYGDAMTKLVIALETGNPNEARRVAGAFAEKVEVLSQPSSLTPLSVPHVPFLLRHARDSGSISAADFDRHRASWIAANATAPRGLLWTFGYAATAGTADDARAALAVAGEYEPLSALAQVASQLPGAVRGRLYLLAGDGPRAVKELETAVSTCSELANPFWFVWAWFDLGQARELIGDSKGACEAYGKVLARWGKAKPRSVTAKGARARAKALGCAP